MLFRWALPFTLLLLVSLLLIPANVQVGVFYFILPGGEKKIKGGRFKLTVLEQKHRFSPISVFSSVTSTKMLEGPIHMWDLKF